MAITAEPACHMDITDVPISVRESDEADEDDQELCNTISQINARQSTELARLRVNYSRASSRHPPETPNHLAKPTTFLGRVKYGVQKFWRHQVSVVVAHEDCRDHLGNFPIFRLQNSPMFTLHFIHSQEFRTSLSMELRVISREPYLRESANIRSLLCSFIGVDMFKGYHCNW